METKTKKWRDHGGEDAVWVKLAVPATGKFRDGLVAVAEQTGVARSAIYHLALRRGLASLQEKGVNLRDLMGLVPSLGFRRGKRCPPRPRAEANPDVSLYFVLGSLRGGLSSTLIRRSLRGIEGMAEGVWRSATGADVS